MIRHGRAPYLECSSKGDRRFSAFCAVIRQKGNRTIEDLYQAFKIFEDGSTGLTWRQAKGRKAVNQEEAAQYYSTLWDLYIQENPELLSVLVDATGLSDIFGQPGHCCQATELWRIRENAMKIEGSITGRLTSKTEVIHIKDKEGSLNEVYIGRPSRFGNPVKIGKGCPVCGVVHMDAGSTLKCYAKHLDHMIRTDPGFEEALQGLKSKTLVCYCKPGPCHGDVIATYLDTGVIPGLLDKPPVVKPIGDYNWHAFIGSREPTEKQEIEIVQAIEQLDPSQDAIISGCADGIDALALMTGKNLGFQTIGILPWAKYNLHVQQFCDHIKVIDDFAPVSRDAAYESVRRHHPAPDRLSQGAMKLHARNYGIIRWACDVTAAPSDKPGGGGTGQGMRLAKELEIPLTTIKPK